MEDKFLYRVAEDLLERFGNDLQHVAVVFNNKRPQLFLKKYLSDISGRPIWSPRFFTIQQFIGEFSTAVAANPLRQFFVLLSCYNKLLKAEGKQPVSADSFYQLGEIILSDFSQIDYYLADASRVFKLIGSIAELQQAFPNFDEEQLAFMESFWSSFSTEKQNDIQQRFIDLWQRMPALYKDFHEELAAENLSTVAGMYRDLAEGRSAKPDFIRNFKHTVFVGFNALSKAEEKIFAGWQEQELASFYFDSDDHYLNDKLHEAGHFLRRNINTIGLRNRLQENGNRISDPAKEIEVIQALGNISQAKILSKIVNTGGQAGPDDKAVILADENLLLPVLQTIPGDTLNITMGYPFAQSAVFGLCELWLTIQEELNGNKSTIEYTHVLAWLFNPLLQIDAGKRDRLHASIIRERLAGIEVHTLSETDASAVKVFAQGHSSSQTTGLLKDLLLEVSLTLPLSRFLEKRLIAEAVKSLNVLSDNLEAVKNSAGELPLKFLLKLIRRALQGIIVPFEGEPLAGMQVMGLLESRCLDFDELIVLGVNEGILPKVSITPSFIPDNIRRAFGLPVLENQNSISAYLFYRLLHHARKITLIYNGITDESSTGEESRFVKQLRFETNCTIKERRQEYGSLQSGSEKRISVEKTGAVWNKLQAYFNPANNRAISATGFTDYLSCPLKFFYGRVARLQEPKEQPDQIEAKMVGNALHVVMQTFYGDAVGTEIGPGYFAANMHKLPRLCQEALSKVLFNRPDAIARPTALQQIVLQVIEKYAKNILGHDERLGRFSIHSLEYSSVLPVRVSIKGHVKTVYLKGIIDRVDEHNGKRRIVDYKTGGDKLEYKNFEELFEAESRYQNKALLQTLFYTYLYEKNRQVSGIEPHLYTVKNLSEGTVFREKRKNGVELIDENLKYFKAEFEQRLHQKLSEIFDPDVPFVQTTNRETCCYCAYKDVCQR